MENMGIALTCTTLGRDETRWRGEREGERRREKAAVEVIGDDEVRAVEARRRRENLGCLSDLGVAAKTPMLYS